MLSYGFSDPTNPNNSFAFDYTLEALLVGAVLRLL